ncbi:MAG: deoxyguanosinetriphosphate triphosphohydrolase [Planctomycetes bacterium]|nr:deoxyguanosinetriphosphate triphosphohydrolase [Planctomycetota bacterium]
MSEFCFHDRAAKEARERRELAPWAMKAGDSRGRAHPEPEDDLRTAWERDRDRLVHSTAFRRLMYKTQVFVNWEGDHYRTRLSHSLEVCQVARSIANALRLNEPFTEALALAHDVGHPPFGHRGEWTLDAAMRDHGGFRHNAQVLRVVDLLERRSPAYPGLNLTRELRESLLKHENDLDWPDEFRPRPRQPYLEAQVVDLADSTAYVVHDLEDGSNAGLFDEAQLIADVALWRRAAATIETRHPGFAAQHDDPKLRLKRITNEILSICIKDLIRRSAERIAAAEFADAEAARSRRERPIDHGDELAPEVAELTRFLHAHFYRHPRVEEQRERAATTLTDLFAAYLADPTQMAPWFQRWRDEVGLERAVCDYVAGMTDRFAEKEHARLLGGAR